jgi:hypothetical protein
MVAGKVFVFWFLMFVFAVLAYAMNQAKQGKVPTMRRIAGLEAIDEGIGRATELGRPIYYTPGRGTLTDSSASDTVAGLEILSYVAEQTARYEVDIAVAISDPSVYPVADEVVREAYSRTGHPDAYRPEMLRYLSPEQFAFGAASLGIMTRERSASAIMMGFFQAESLLLAEGAVQAGAISIGGCTRLYQIPFFVAACDYVLIGEELYAASSILSRNPIKLGSLVGQDIVKLVASALIIIGALLSTAKNNVLLDLIKK